MRLHALASLLALTALAPTISQAADGTITVTGQVTANTCTITSGSAGNHTVNLPPVSANALKNVGDTAGRTPVLISLSSCTPATGKVSLFFEPGVGTDMTTGKLKNSAAATPSNVEIGLLNADFSAIALNQGKSNQNSQEVDLTTGAADLRYYAEYVAATSAATAGAVEASTAFTIIYP